MKWLVDWRYVLRLRVCVDLGMTCRKLGVGASRYVAGKSPPRPLESIRLEVSVIEAAHMVVPDSADQLLLTGAEVGEECQLVMEGCSSRKNAVNNLWKALSAAYYFRNSSSTPTKVLGIGTQRSLQDIILQERPEAW